MEPAVLGSNSSSVSGVGATPSPATHSISSKSVSTHKGDTCGCGTDGIPRSCGDCLNVALQSGEQCFINPFGMCVSANDAASYLYLFNAMSTARGTANASVIPFANEYFSSWNETYCTNGDSKCLQCRAQWTDDFGRSALQSTESFSCVGESDCICTAYCELWAANIVTVTGSVNIGSNEACYASSLDWSSKYSASVALARNVAMLFGGAVMIVLAVRMGVMEFHQKRHERRMRERRQALREQRNEVNHSGGVLTLDGWNGYREQLIGREQESLGLKFGPLLTEAPSCAVVEEGEGLRPGSPSQLTGHHSA